MNSNACSVSSQTIATRSEAEAETAGSCSSSPSFRSTVG
jgi:hypothetical protein